MKRLKISLILITIIFIVSELQNGVIKFILIKLYIANIGPVLSEMGMDPGEPEVIELHKVIRLSLIHISEPTRLLSIAFSVFCV